MEALNLGLITCFYHLKSEEKKKNVFLSGLKKDAKGP